MREPKYSGLFYPKEKNELLKEINNYLQKNPFKELNKKIKAIIVPHAGYVYSGGVASRAFNSIKNSSPKKIVLIGPSHQEYFVGAKTFNENWVTPLGVVNVTPTKLGVMKNDSEHSLEVQVPFLQVVLKDFFLTPIIYSDISPQELVEVIPENDLIIISSDLSHFLDYDEAKKKDLGTIQKILDLDFEGLSKVGDACGLTGLITITLIAKKNNWKPILLEYKNSGDITNTKKEVVGYASIIFVE